MDTRARILRAALDHFDDLGYDRTSISRIRETSGVSNGALFHHFPNKEAIAQALYVDAMRSVQRGYWAALDNEPATLREIVDDTVRNLLTWVESNPRWARFLYAQDHLDSSAELRTLNNELAAGYRKRLDTFITAGTALDLPMVVVVAIVTGPAHALARRWLSGHIAGPLASYADNLVDAAVAGLSGIPTSTGGHRPALPVEGRIHIQLLNADGVVCAEGHGSTELTPAATIRHDGQGQ